MSVRAREEEILQRYAPKPEEIPTTPEGRLHLLEQIRRAVSEELYGGYPDRVERKIRVIRRSDSA